MRLPQSGAKFLAVRCSGDGAAAFLDLGRSTRMWSRPAKARKRRHQHLASYCSYADAVGVAWNV